MNEDDEEDEENEERREKSDKASDVLSQLLGTDKLKDALTDILEDGD